MNKIKVLIADDEAEYTKSLAEGLEILGYDVFTALTGTHAIEVISHEKPDIVLCDYKLEDMDGTKIIENTKKANPGTIYIMVTAYYDESANDMFRRAGASEIIYKPIQIMELDSMIKKLLGDAKKVKDDKNTAGR